ncbi:MAG: hypothetical protein Q9170_006515 [Blastenia crenularia]
MSVDLLSPSARPSAAIGTHKRKPGAALEDDASGVQPTIKRRQGRPTGTTKDAMRQKLGVLPKKELRPRGAVIEKAMPRKSLAALTAQPTDDTSGFVKKGRGRPTKVVSEEAKGNNIPAATKGENVVAKKRGRPAGSKTAK